MLLVATIQQVNGQRVIASLGAKLKRNRKSRSGGSGSTATGTSTNGGDSYIIEGEGSSPVFAVIRRSVSTLVGDDDENRLYILSSAGIGLLVTIILYYCFFVQSGKNKQSNGEEGEEDGESLFSPRKQTNKKNHLYGYPPCPLHRHVSIFPVSLQDCFVNVIFNFWCDV